MANDYGNSNVKYVIKFPLSHGAAGKPVAANDIVQPLPMALSGRSTTGSALFTPSTISYDYSLGGMPLISYITDQTPYIRGLAPIRKSQFDNQQIPGEQSLTGWWLRSESTFLGGQGLLYQDPTQSRFNNEYGIRYGSGYGVNPWTDGQITLLKTTSLDKLASGNDVLTQGYANAGTDYYWFANGNVFDRIDASGNVTIITWGGSLTIQSLTSSGNKYYVADNAGVWSGTDAGAGTKLWNNDVSYTRTTIGYAKQRLMAAFNNKVYALGADPSSPPINLSTLAANYVHPNANYTWTSFADGTDAIFAGGHDGHQGHIFKFVLDTTGAVPVLTGGILAADLPDGELLYDMFTYLGSFIGLATSRGFRVGQIDTNGDIQYGPLIFEITGGCKTVTGFDRFMWVGATNAVNGSSGLYRVDLGQPIQIEGGSPSIRYAYATDLSTHVTGTVTSVSTIGISGRRVIGVNSAGAYSEHATNLEQTGVMSTGRIRFNTLENKLFKFLSIKTPFSFPGTLQASVTDTTNTTENLVTYNGTSPGANDVSVSFPQGPQEYVTLNFTLQRSPTDATAGPTLNGWQLKAVPGVIRQRMFNLTVLMFDFEEDRTGQKNGYAGRAQSRLRTIEAAIQTGQVLNFQDLNAGTADLVFVEDMEFRQVSSPGKGLATGVLGGYLTLKLRTVNDNITVVTQ